MRPRELLSEYLNGQIGEKEVRMRLGRDGSREARKAVEMLNMDQNVKQVLLDFGPAGDARERLVEQVVSVDSWIPQGDQQRSRASSGNWLANLTPAFDVVGHEHIAKKKKKRAATPRKQRKPGRKHKK